MGLKLILIKILRLIMGEEIVDFDFNNEINNFEVFLIKK